MQGRKTCMQSMKQQAAAIGRSLQNTTSRNFTDLINTLVKDGKEKLHGFNENGLYLANLPSQE